MTDSERAASDTVREALRARGLRQQDLAEVLHLSQAAISHRLTGRTPFKLAELDGLAAHLGITVGELLEPPASLVDEPEAEA